MRENEFNLWKLLEVITKRRKFIILFVLIVTVISIVTAFLLPKWYQAKALMLPPKDEGFKLGWTAGAINDAISLTSGIKLPIMATTTDIYARILGSRALADRVIETQGLDKYYDLPIGQDLYTRIEDNSDFKVTPEGLLEITYLDKDPQKAAEITNSFADQLDLMNRELASDRAKIVREFLEKRMHDVYNELETSRADLKDFQAEHKAIDLDRQTQLAIEAAIGLKVDLAKDEIDLSVKEKSLSPTHPDVIMLKNRIAEINRQIKQLEFGGNDSSYLSLPISEVPGLKIKYSELASKVAISEGLYKILQEQFEQAKIQEKMNTPTISLIDRATAPELPVKPQKKLIVIAAFILSFITALFIALFFNYLDNLKVSSPSDYERARGFMLTFFGWVPGIKKSLK